ncbi:hypothetical protein M404DRAFT_414425 [Pisolithus tinctorius Marx 270]|uniref:Uncharacterized protein n=1 Tax=Pisolithus tinctorius Marx 270 TaxID=870435 RepID=A0A0C3NEY0_PISTI|nr:hypothetical protein M404DRAFT_414425 [Pisolithus tinctorius Marx 270]
MFFSRVMWPVPRPCSASLFQGWWDLKFKILRNRHIKPIASCHGFGTGSLS